QLSHASIKQVVETVAIHIRHSKTIHKTIPSDRLGGRLNAGVVMRDERESFVRELQGQPAIAELQRRFGGGVGRLTSAFEHLSEGALLGNRIEGVSELVLPE